MKRGLLFIFTFFFSLNFILANSCNLDISLLNQEPYPAIPGETVKVVFQVDGISSQDCGDISLGIVESFPFSLDPSSESSYTIKSGTFTKDYQSYFMAPFTLKVNEDANNGLTKLEVKYQTINSASTSYILKTFNLEVKNVKADFDIFVRDYNSLTNQIIFEILNIADSDIKAVMVEVPTQDGLEILGANKQNIGDLYSKEDATANLKLRTENDYIDLIIHYSDLTNSRRSIEKRVEFHKENFSSSDVKEGNNNFWVILIILIIVGFIFYRYRKNKKKKLKELHS